MSHSYFDERAFLNIGLPMAAVEWLRGINEAVKPGTISLDISELEALQHEFRLLRNQLDELRSRVQNAELEQFHLPDQHIIDMSRDVILIDPTTGAKAYINQNTNRLQVESIDYAHQKVHAGDFYTVSYLANSVASASSIEILIITGATYDLHTVFSASAGGDAEIYIYEDTTVSSNGTGLTAYNNLRSSANTAEASFYHTPTITADGTKLYEDFIPGGGVFGMGGSDGGPIRSGTELDLKTGTNYLLRLTNTSGGAQDLALALGFYEES